MIGWTGFSNNCTPVELPHNPQACPVFVISAETYDRGDTFTLAANLVE